MSTTSAGQRARLALARGCLYGTGDCRASARLSPISYLALTPVFPLLHPPCSPQRLPNVSLHALASFAQVQLKLAYILTALDESATIPAIPTR